MALNISMVAALPLLAMGLGVNDVFVIVRYFSELGIDYITDKDETHQRACEAELLACRETMTLVLATTIGPTAAEKANTSVIAAFAFITLG